MRIFFKWLKENDAYEAYKENFLKTKEIGFPTFCERNPMFSFFTTAFTWRSTSEGFDYWREIEKEWITYLERLRL